MRRAFVGILPAAILLAGCHSTPTSGADAGPTASTTAASSGQPAPTMSAPALSGDKLTLQGGGALKLPEGAKPAEVKPGRLPKESKKAHLFHLGSEKRLLMVNELGVEGGSTCKDLLDKEWTRMSEAKADTDPTRLKFRRMRVVEDLTLEGQRALYIEFEQQGLAGGEGQERPKAALASLTSCRGSDHFVVTFASDQLELPPGTRAMLEAIVKSYTPAP